MRLWVDVVKDWDVRNILNHKISYVFKIILNNSQMKINLM